MSELDLPDFLDADLRRERPLHGGDVGPAARETTVLSHDPVSVVKTIERRGEIEQGAGNHGRFVLPDDPQEHLHEPVNEDGDVVPFPAEDDHPNSEYFDNRVLLGQFYPRQHVYKKADVLHR